MITYHSVGKHLNRILQIFLKKLHFSEKNYNFLKKNKALPFKVSFTQYYLASPEGPNKYQKNNGCPEKYNQ